MDTPYIWKWMFINLLSSYSYNCSPTIVTEFNFSNSDHPNVKLPNNDASKYDSAIILIRLSAQGYYQCLHGTIYLVTPGLPCSNSYLIDTNLAAGQVIVTYWQFTHVIANSACFFLSRIQISTIHSSACIMQNRSTTWSSINHAQIEKCLSLYKTKQKCELKSS